jgi:DNA-binding LacI/PurR family transcriptional regulator
VGTDTDSLSGGRPAVTGGRALSNVCYNWRVTADPPFPRALTLDHVAQVAGVSRATVSRVINQTRNVDPEIQRVVQEAVAATGYVPNRAARSLVTRRTGLVALAVSTAEAFDEPFSGQVLVDSFFGRALNGVMRYLRSHDGHLVLMLVDSEEARAQLMGYLHRGEVDGCLLISMNAEDPLPRLLADAGLPAVLFARPALPMPLSYVDVNQQFGTRLAADHLVARGCRRIGMVAGPRGAVAGQDRLSGFHAAMAVHGHPYVPWEEGDFTAAGGHAAMERLLAGHPDIDGVFAANDLMAQGALSVLHEHGRRVPDDVAVVGFDDSDAALACRPPLTTVRQPVEEMAVEMARVLMSRIEGPNRRPTSVILEPTLVVRESA